MKLKVFKAATPNDQPPENLGTKKEVEVPNFGTCQQGCRAFLEQFPGEQVSYYSLPGWTKVAESTFDALSNAAQGCLQLRVYKQGDKSCIWTS